jgi:hypothetical protein
MIRDPNRARPSVVATVSAMAAATALAPAPHRELSMAA